MAADFGFVLGNGQQHLGHSVAYVVSHHVFHEEHSHEHTQTRINQEEIVPEVALPKPEGQAVVYALYEEFQKNRRKTAKHSHQQGKHHHQVLFRKSRQEFAQSGKYSEFQRIIFIHKRVKSSKDIAYKDRKIFPSSPNAKTGRPEFHPSARIIICFIPTYYRNIGTCSVSVDSFVLTG